MYINIYVQVSKYVASESNNNILSIVDVVVATLSPKVCSFLAGRVYWWRRRLLLDTGTLHYTVAGSRGRFYNEACLDIIKTRHTLLCATFQLGMTCA